MFTANTLVTASTVKTGLAALAAAAAVAAAVAGCSSGSSSSAAGASPSASAAPSAPASAAAPATAGSSGGALPTTSMTPLQAAAGQLTGTQLQSVLLPLTDFPAGYATPTTGPVTSGGSLTGGRAAYDLGTMSCATFLEKIGGTGFGETAMVSGSAETSGQAFDQLIYQFANASGATSFVSGVQSLARRCGSFKLTSGGQTGTFALKAGAGAPVGGHPTAEVTETGTVGTSKVALSLLLCASGVDVFGAGAVGASGTAAPATPTRQAVVYQLMKRQAAAAELS